MTPPRPVPVTAAAVLLFVVSAELLLAAVGSAVASVFVPTALFPACVGGAAATALVGGLLLRVAVRFWLGRLPSLDGIEFGVGLLANVATILAAFAAWLLYMAFTRPRPPTEKLVSIVSGAAFLWANMAALIVAWWLLRHRAAQYLAWRDSLRGPTDAGE